VDAWVKSAVDGYLEVTDGYFGRPQGPGLGVTLREDFIAEHPPRGGSMNLFAKDWHKRQGSVS
jgi:galactonate dehydratase